MDAVKAQEKYKSWPHFIAAYAYRQLMRARLARLVSWKRVGVLEPGCTAVLGLCSKLPGVLAANLECLEKAKWPELKEVVIAVDSKKGALSDAYVEDIQRRFGALNVRFVYYSERQHAVADKLKLPYVYCWLSWIVAMNEARTRTILIHDYDALILNNILERRYRRFVESGAVMQGVLWYWTNGIVAEDRLAATFEAFVDTAWIRRFHPIQQLNQVGLLKGRRVDYDILTDMQANKAKPQERDVFEMTFDDLVHPTQMIHQYTVYRKTPGKPWHCASLLMIPFFYHRSGDGQFLRQAAARVRASRDKNIELIGDGVVMNFEQLTPELTHWMLKQMVQVCVKMGTAPFKDLIEYGNAFYELCSTPAEERWVTSFDAPHRQWISAANAA